MTTTPTASPELSHLDHLEALARAATPGPWSWWTSNSTLRLTGADGRDGGVLYGYARQGDGDVNCAPNDQAFIAAANPAAVLALIALARRAQPEGEASLVEGDAIARSKRILHLVDEYVEQQTAGRRTALRCALMDQFSRDITPHQLLEVARATGLRQFLHGVNATDARQLLADFVAAVPAAAFGVQQAAAPGALPDWRWVPAEPTLDMITSGFESAPDEFFSPTEEWEAYAEMTGCQKAAHRARLCYAAMLAAAPAAPCNSPEIPEGSLADEGTSAPCTPEAPANQDAKDAARYRVLRQHVLPHAVGIQMDRKPPARQPVEERIDLLCDIVIERRAAAQLDGGQEGSESNG